MSKTVSEECPSCASVGASMAQSEKQTPYRLSHWPIQIKLIGTVAPFLQDADLLVAADCTAFATPDFHTKFLKEHKVLIGCPKLDNAQIYVDKFTEMFSNIPIKKVSCLRMEVPCCGGMTVVLKEAITRSGKSIPLTETIIGIKGDVLAERPVLE